MKNKIIKKEIVYQYTISEIIKALGLKIPKSKEIEIRESYYVDEAEQTIEIVVTEEYEFNEGL